MSLAGPVVLCPGFTVDGLLGVSDAVCASGAGVFAFDVAFVPAVDGGVEYGPVDVHFVVVECLDGVGDDHVEDGGIRLREWWVWHFVHVFDPTCWRICCGVDIALTLAMQTRMLTAC